MNLLTRDRLAQLFSYDPETGDFIRLPGQVFRPKGGDVAGCFKSGYLVIRIDGVLYRAHRLAWLYMTGAWPNNEIDHINGIKSDNRFANLRDVDLSVNRQNQVRPRRNNKSGYLGVCLVASRGKFRADITVNGKNRGIGYFNTAAEASAAYISAKRKFHTGNTL